MNRKVYLLIFFSCFLTWASIELVHLPWVLDEEEDLLTKPTGLKKFLNKSVLPNQLYDTSFVRNHFLIINTTKDQELTSEEDSFSDNTPGIPITNRGKLCQLFKLLNEDTSLYNFVICDVKFELSSTNKSNDDSLQNLINELQLKHKIIFGLPYSTNKESFEDSKIQIDYKNIGVTNIESVSGYYFKHQITYTDGMIKSLPFLMYTKHNNIKVQSLLFPDIIQYSTGNHSSTYYNSFIPEILFGRAEFDKYYYQNNDLSKLSYDSTMAVIDLGKVVSDTMGLYLQSLLYKKEGKKDIFIGAITGEHADKHKTIYGTFDGVIILINTYFCIQQGYNDFSIWHILVSFLIFLFISYRILFHKKHPLKANVSGWRYILKEIYERLYYLCLVLLTAISYFIFNHPTNVIVLIILIEGLHFLVKHFDDYKIVKKNYNSRVHHSTDSNVINVN